MNDYYIEEPEKYKKAIQSISYKCKKCGHNAVIPKFVKKQICSWCGHYVYSDAKEEFKDKFKIESRKLKLNKE